ncbi:DNA repair protein RecO [Aequorivita sp. H23M31]|uniref:DNA repair protein RecO n=1 Tax=Aequorivita ciconiae TaxID=2494375 RepID=A0A410G5C8_9FLAO|nr:DNA repair protein RecO [Aequorivita sp. H23M31]QAA82463.1 DNA repair protein RecO [Aequorivita sp. H23M31]
MIVKTKAIVFSAIKYSEADLIACCYTESDGVKSYLLRNILKSKKSGLKASYFQPLTQLDIIANHKDKGTLEYIREAKVSIPYVSLHTNIVKSSLVMFLAEMLKNCIREEEANPMLFGFLEDSLSWLDQNDGVANFHIYFLLRISHFIGFYPDASNMNLDYFNILEGNFQDSKTTEYCLQGETVEDLKRFFNSSLYDMGSIKLSKTSRSSLLELLLSYYKLHIQGYQRPKSLSVINQIFV